MKLLFDEHVGNRVARALELTRYVEIDWVTRRFGTRGRAAQGVPDAVWLATVGADWLVLTEDDAILQRPEERNLLLQYQIGLICLDTSHATAGEVLHFVVCQSHRLRLLHETTPRPFAYLASLNGAFTQVPLQNPT